MICLTGLDPRAGSERGLLHRAAALAGPGVVLRSGLAATALRGRPGVVLRGATLAAATEVAATLGSATATTEVAAAATVATGPHGLGDLGGRAAQAGTDLVDVDLEDRALLALTVVVRTRLEPALHDHAHSALQRLGHVLRGLAPDGTAQEQRFAVLPFTGLPVVRPWGRRDPEVRDGRTGRREPELRIVDKIADQCDDGFACHCRSSCFRV